jgi:hemoglobin/transferrin/lactoferrin receptor protein
VISFSHACPRLLLGRSGHRHLFTPVLVVLALARAAHAQLPADDAAKQSAAPDPAGAPTPSAAPAEPTPPAAPEHDGDLDGTPELRGHEIIITSAARRDEPVFQSPRAVSIVDRIDLQERASRTTPEALLEEVGVFVQRTNHGGGAPIIRGQLGNRILLLVDGVRLNNSSFRQGPNQYLNTIDPLAVDRLEVVRGPGSALYGSDAIGGLINVLTERPRISGEGVYGGVRLVSASMDRSAQLGMRMGWAGDRVGVLASASYRRFGDLRGGNGYEQPFTGYEQWSATGSGTIEVKRGQQLAVSVQADTQGGVPRSDRSFPLDFRLFSAQERQLGYARYSVARLGPFREAAATVSVGRQRELQTRYRVGRGSRAEDDLAVATFGVQLGGELDVAGPLVTGAELYVDQFAMDAASGPLTGALTADPTAMRYPEGVGYLTAAVFAHHELALAPQWKLLGDLRLGAIRIQLPTDDRLVQLFPEENLPVLPRATDVVPVYAAGLHARWEATPWAAVSAGAMLGFRAPNIDDYARSGVEGPGYQIPARSLDPERAWSGEIGVKLLPGGADISATYAYTLIDDAIARRVTSLGDITTIDGLRVLQSGNTDSARYHSVELAAMAPIWQQLSAFGQFSWTRGEQRTSDPVAMTTTTEPTTKTPPPFGTLGLRWNAPAARWFGEGLLRYALDQERISELDRGDPRICPDVPGECRGTPGWAVLVVRGGARIGSRLRVTLALENLTDETYRYHASGIQGAGLGVSGVVEGTL